MKGFILDGFPRTIVQAKALDAFTTIDNVLYVDTPNEICIKRIMGRRNCPSCMKDYNIYFSPPRKGDLCDKCNIILTQRKDDTEVIINERIRVYELQTKPLVEYYKHRVISINDDGKISADELFQEIVKLLGK